MLEVEAGIAQAPGTLVIAVGGELDLSVAGRLGEAIECCSGAKQILIDLEACDFIDSTGIAVIVRAHLRPIQTCYERELKLSPEEEEALRLALAQ